jgi:predicted RNA-binding protein with PUA-like domain
MQYWLIKSEPSVYPFSQLKAEGRTLWEGVRNYQARNYMRMMEVGDLALYYHSNEGKAIVGLAKISARAIPDPTAPGKDWSAVEVEPVDDLPNPVSLQQLREDPELQSMNIFRQLQLSIVEVSADHFKRISVLAAYDGSFS